MDAEAGYIWHNDANLGSFDAVVLPGGFSYGDYLRCGAVARFSPVMESVRLFAEEGGLVIGICNGFQILLEAGLLPGAMIRNKGLKFICRHVDLRVENADTPFTIDCEEGQVFSMPIAHNEGNYFADWDTLKKLNENKQVILRYSAQNGEVAPHTNPNGAIQNIAGICSESRNIFGLMPHPERAVDPDLGSSDGRLIFSSMIRALTEKIAVG